MNVVKLLAFSFLSLFFLGCNEKKTDFTIQIEGNKKEFQLGDAFNIDVVSKKNIAIDSVSYEISNKKLKISKGSIILEGVLLGNQEIKATVFFNNTSEVVSKRISIFSNKAPKIYTYEIINQFPHDIKAYTQGLEFYNDTLYEGTGRNGQSTLRKLDYKTGKVIKKIELASNYFGEGITILNDKIYQLTWQKKTGFVYDLNTFEKISDFVYGDSREGWGLCNDGNVLYKSDGTNKIWILNPNTLIEERYIQTVTNSSIFSKANELEYANGKIYANTYQKDGVMIINPDTGAIEGVVDFRGLIDKTKKHKDIDVLNGIAYHPTKETFFVTGKNWDTLFEVKIIAK